VGQAQKYMAMHCSDKDEGFRPQMERHPKADLGQRAVEVLSCCPVCQWAQWPVNN